MCCSYGPVCMRHIVVTTSECLHYLSYSLAVRVLYLFQSWFLPCPQPWLIWILTRRALATFADKSFIRRYLWSLQLCSMNYAQVKYSYKVYYRVLKIDWARNHISITSTGNGCHTLMLVLLSTLKQKLEKAATRVSFVVCLRIRAITWLSTSDSTSLFGN